MTNKKREFIILCDKLIKLYKETFKKDISLDDIIKSNKFKYIYHDLAKVYHTDKGAIGEEMSILNGLRDELNIFLNDSTFMKSLVSEKEENVDLVSYRKEMIEKLKGLEKTYSEIKDIFKYDIDIFENLVLFANTKAEVTGFYYETKNNLNLKLQKKKYIDQVTSELRGFVDKRNHENMELFNKFKKEAELCYNIGDVSELYEQYQVILKKNSFAFVLSDSLNRLCLGYNDEKIKRCILEATNKVKLINFDADKDCENLFMKIYVSTANEINIRKNNLDLFNSLDKLMKSCLGANYDGIYIGNILKCTSIESAEIIYNDLKESINSRIEFSKRVGDRVDGFLNKCKQNPDNTFTYPFISKEVSKLFSYYDPMDKNLSKLDTMLAILEKEIISQREIDLEKATNKREKLRHKFNQDFEDGIFLKNGQQFLDYNLEQVSTFGGFADFENKMIRMELPRVVADVYNYLSDVEERIRNEKNIKDKKDRLNLVNSALEISMMFAKICKQTNNYKKIKISNSVSGIDYREFSALIQSLKNIDYLNGSIDELVNIVSFFNEILYGDDFDDELENMVNKRR